MNRHSDELILDTVQLGGRNLGNSTEGANHTLIQTYLDVLPNVSWAFTETCVVRYNLPNFGLVSDLPEQDQVTS